MKSIVLVFVLHLFVGWSSEADSYPPVIEAVNLSRHIVFVDCNEETCESDQVLKVTARASDMGNDVISYSYKVSGGRVFGKGKQVTWDLTGLEPGEYTISTLVDDGCGVCAEPHTTAIELVERPKGLDQESPAGFVTGLDLGEVRKYEDCVDEKCEIREYKYRIPVETMTLGPSDAKVNFRYEISEGFLVGHGRKVTWVINKPKSEEVSITVSTDEGNGYLNPSVTEYIRVE